jgi:hypothetical protein
MTRIEVTESCLQLALADGSSLELPRAQMPARFLEWQSGSRLALFEKLSGEGASGVKQYPAHLAVLATGGEGVFPINLAARGIGLVPLPERLEECTGKLETARGNAAGFSWAQSLPLRLQAAGEVYGFAAGFDSRLLGGLEIFEGRTAANLEKRPLASLLFSGEPPDYPSLQLNVVVQRVQPSDSRYRFLLAARELFAFDAFHLRQSRYPYGYLFHVSEVLDKTPFPRG